MSVVLNPHSPACACARCVRGEGERKREKERGNVERLSLPPLEFSPLHLLPTASLPSAPTRSPRAVRLHMRRLRLRVPRTKRLESSCTPNSHDFHVSSLFLSLTLLTLSLPHHHPHPLSLSFCFCLLLPIVILPSLTTSPRRSSMTGQ